MKRTKKAGARLTPIKSHKKTGPKSKCTPEVIRKTTDLCRLGLTDWQLAEYFGVSEDTIGYWKKTRPAFKQAIEEGKIDSDKRVAKALFRRATGWYEPSVKFFKDTVTEKEYDEEGNLIKEKSYGRIIEHPYDKFYPPETKAAIKWLNARQTDKWAEIKKHQHDHRHLHAGIQPSHLTDQISNPDKFTEEELELAVKLGLQQQVRQLESSDQ